MHPLPVQSYAHGNWLAPGDGARTIENAVTGDVMATAGNDALDVGAMLEYARKIGGPALRAFTFHDRARMLKALALELGKHKQALYEISFATGATQKDHLIDIDGGIGTLFVFASKGRRELPAGRVYCDGDIEQLSRNGSFIGQHIATPLQGVGVHINAYNFPVWGMLEKLAPCILAGVPAIVKPATSSCYVTELAVKIIINSGIFPAGALQLICGGTGALLEHLGAQDVVSFTGSATTARKLRQTPSLVNNATRFIAEQDSLNGTLLGPDITPDAPEFSLFLKEVTREMTAKAGQKCTAIRRIIVPETLVDTVAEELKIRLEAVKIGDPRDKDTQMGALISAAQKRDVLERVELLSQECTKITGEVDGFTGNGVAPSRGTGNSVAPSRGAFLPPMLFHCGDPDQARHVHETEAFGPVSTLMGYRDIDHGLGLVNRGQGSLVASVITRDPDVARTAVSQSAAWHGRLYFNNRDSMAESTGHGSPLPHMVHGGPGRAGGGEEMGGIRGVMHYMQRTAIQGSPDLLAAIAEKWLPGAATPAAPAHPFTRGFHTLEIGETLRAGPRHISLEDIEKFAEFTGDTFYAHMDDAAAARNPFFPGRVAHGYLLLSFAAGMFVHPDEGPVLANTGLDNLRFLTPVAPGDSIDVQVTVKAKTPRNDDYGEVRWQVVLRNGEGAVVAEYELLTMNAYAMA